MVFWSFIVRRKGVFLFMLGVILSGCTIMAPPILLKASEPFSLLSTSNWMVMDYKDTSKTFSLMNSYSGMQRYITQVVHNNVDLKSISATAKSARYNMKMVHADIQPRADLNFSKVRSKDVLKKENNTASVGVDLRWRLDVWGKLADDVAAAQYLSDKTHYDLQHFRRVLIRQSARLWIEYRGYVHAEKYFMELNKVHTNISDYYRDSYQVGLVSYGFFLDAKNSWLHSAERLEDIQLKKLKTIQLMNVLRGRSPNDQLPITDDNASLNWMSFKGKVSVAALSNRPDIQSAFLEVRALNRMSHSAHKALLPQINLTGTLFKSGTTLEKVFSGDLLWQFVGGLAQPLLNGGQLRAFFKQKSTESEASWWQYQNTIFKAILEVENAIANEQFLLWQMEQKQRVLTHLAQKFFSAEARFSDGDLSFPNYFLVKAERIEALIELNSTDVLYTQNRVDLMMALGLPLEMDFEIDYEKNHNEKP